MPIDRFFTRRQEILVGAGFLVSLPSFDFHAGRELSVDPYEYEQAASGETNNPCGIQLRAAYHFYLFRNFSLSAGLEINLYQNVNMPDAEFYGDDIPPPAPEFEAHSLNYSTVRFKVGAHLYF